jgi:hypothetical protein
MDAPGPLEHPPATPVDEAPPDWTTGWAVSEARLRDLVEAPEESDDDEVALLAAEHQVARYLIGELVEERDETAFHADFLTDERRVLIRAVDAAVEWLCAVTGEDPDTVLLAVGARPEWLPAHPDDGGCGACGPSADDVPF